MQALPFRVASLLSALSGSGPASACVSVACSLLCVYFAFLVMPGMDFVLGRDLRNKVRELTSFPGHASISRFQDGMLRSIMPGMEVVLSRDLRYKMGLCLSSVCQHSLHSGASHAYSLPGWIM